MKIRNIEIFLAIVFYLLAISEEFLKLGMFSWLYSVVNQTVVFAFLLIVATAFVVTYIFQSTRRSEVWAYAQNIRRRPLNVDILPSYPCEYYSVKWILHEPDFLERQPWADGPYCLECDRELDEKTKGHVLRREIWKCPMCGKEYPRPKGNVQDMVEKNFAAYLRKKRKL